ncbi:hypothetical protein BOTBODRAFT_177345 [Botryobasidium botryosum FD-172 SS1]|uniref:G domain-containing protein n=1 Tax=Botryobasidium botryosum (strain FD-172 SS1) TaxID=930990 RepID=A0A067MIC4_BOTB1|nr:hypothetical protein BOTBODRAFT_177345 [Botryobasidium botryosum FD-172 SS1]
MPKPQCFRVLIIRRANAGKTTVLRAVCGTDEEPKVYDRKGHKVGSFRTVFRSARNKIAGAEGSGAILSPCAERGLHDIEYSMVFPSCPGFIFHDSRGFESGATDELDVVRDFIQARVDGKEQLHIIWYCIPTDTNRVITAAERVFFENIDTGRVPVLVLFTKLDALDAAAYTALEANGLSPAEAKKGAPAYAEEQFKKTHLPLINDQPYPPKGVVCLRSIFLATDLL